ncbi:Methyl-CpG DNA binding,DNA-binding domain [Cinara cedri]|uniref:Methyl-CpG DNA binding,DNA-binding domain n=1 Tax=Cinara cedri TaxID=506608 RepID=A0A5E4N2X0_9HEMI|nr:Methyl-CpG DNA binding,DNA-binding domain [Cinara cedri]
MSSTTGSQSSSGKYGRRRNTDNINDPKFKLPFNYGWTRELVRRKPKIKGKIQFDVYYYDPTNKKARSLKEVKIELKSKTPLTIKNFTFLKQPIGMDESMEIIRDANPKGKRLVDRRSRPRIIESDEDIEPLNTTTSTTESYVEERHASQSTDSP